MDKFLNFMMALILSLVWTVHGWMCSLPCWLLLIAHFVFGISIWWFWGTLFAWIGLTALWLVFARACGRCTHYEQRRDNKNPYSIKPQNF